jgi:serine/threonine protein kinase
MASLDRTRSHQSPARPPLSPDDEDRLLAAVQEYMNALEAGERPRRDQFLKRYPDLAAALADCLDALDFVRAGASGLQPAAAKAPPPGADPALAHPLGDFRLVREIGRGGMGVVYEAVQLSLGRRVAVKVLPFAAAVDDRRLQRFRNEAHAAAQLHHTNIVPVYAVGCERGVHFYAMQMIDGQPLTTFLEQLRQMDAIAPPDAGAPFALATGLLSGNAAARPEPETRDARTEVYPRTDPDDLAGVITDGPPTATATTGRGRGQPYFRTVARLGIQAAEALEHAHQMGIVHRDIKPANLLVDARGMLWVTDFGLALLATDGGLTVTGDVLGTLRYMSPEQAAGDRVVLDHRTDVYSLGATLYELLTLRPAFAGNDQYRILDRIRRDDPPAPRSLDRSVPVELETIVLKAMAKAPADRYPTARALADDLDRFLHDRPIQARRPSWWDRARKWSRRHPSVVWAGVVVLALSVSGLGVNNWLVDRERRKAEARAEETTRLYLKAREAVDRLTRVAAEELADQPHANNAYRRLLEVALESYGGFLDERRDDPKAQQELQTEQARVRQIVADLAALQGGPPEFLLNSADVRKELETTAAQEEALAGMKRQWEQERGEAARGFRELSSEERLQKLAAYTRAQERAIAGVLTGAQLHRLRQVALQHRGMGAFQQSEVVDRLKLTPAQRQQIRRIEMDTVFVRPQKSSPSQRPASFAERTRLAVERVVGEVLTEPQRAAWHDLTGEPFAGEIGFPGGPRGFGPPGGFRPPGAVRPDGPPPPRPEKDR